jgi:hypothetical protein
MKQCHRRPTGVQRRRTLNQPLKAENANGWFLSWHRRERRTRADRNGDGCRAYLKAVGRLSWRPLGGAVTFRSPMRSPVGAPLTRVRTTERPYEYGHGAVVVES